MEAAKPGGQQGFFAVAAKTLRGWAEEIGRTAPAVIAAAEAVILLVGKIRGWVQGRSRSPRAGKGLAPGPGGLACGGGRQKGGAPSAGRGCVGFGIYNRDWE